MSCRSSGTYHVRGSLKGALPGPQYQVQVALHFMLTALQRCQRFEAMMELDGVGALDDIIITIRDAKDLVLERHFLQLKHNTAREPITANQLLKNKSGLAVQVYQYFDDWYLFLSGKCSKLKRPELVSVEPYFCVYYTNRPLCHDLQMLEDAQPAPSALSNPDPFPTSPKYSKFISGTLPQQLVDSCKKNSLLANRQLVDSDRQDQNSPTLKRARMYYREGYRQLNSPELENILTRFLADHFRIAASQPDTDDFNHRLSAQLRDVDPNLESVSVGTVLDLLLQAVWQWFRKLEIADVWNDEILRQHIRSINSDISHIPRLCGVSLHRVQAVMMRVQLFVERSIETLQPLRESLELSAGVSAWLGKPGAGKTTLLAECLLARDFKSFLYFDKAEEFFSYHPSGSGAISLLCVDNVKQSDMRKLQSMLPWERKERLILLSHEALRWPDNGPLQHVTLPDLAPDEVANFLAQREKKDAGVQLGQLFVGLCRQSSVEGPVEGALGDFEKQPGTLAQLCELALHSNEVLSPPLPFTPYVTTETKSPVQLLQMRARRRVPKYGLLDLLSSALFNRHIVLTCDPDFDLRRSIKRELPGEDSTSKRYPCIEAEALEGALAVAKSEIESSAEMLRQVIRARLLPKDQGNGAAVLVIFDPRNSLPSCSEAARAEVMSLSDRLILVPGASSDWSREETVLVLHCESDEPLLFVPVSESMAPLPPTGKWHTRQSASDVICAIRHGFQAQVESVLVVSESGGGKSSVLKMLHRECAVTARPDSAIRLEHGVERVSWPWAGRFSNVVALTFRQLLTEAGRTSVGSTNLSCEVPMDNLGKVLLQFMCVTNPVLRRVFIADLKARRVILLLDSWDELPMRSGKSDPFVASVLFATGQCPVVVTTKTIHDVVQADGLDSLFKKGFDLVLSLDLFNDAQISEYVYGCFASTGALVDSGLASRRNEFCQQLCHHIKSSSATMPTLGLPLQCFLMCEAYWPIFKNLDHGGIPEPLHILPRVKLYRGFLGCRLRKRLITRFSLRYDQDGATLASARPESEVSMLGGKYADVLQKAAFGFLFEDVKISFSDDDWFADDIKALGLIDPFGEFVHRTYAEYLAAIHLAAMLVSDRSNAELVIQKYRYQSRFMTTFEFLAGVVSYGDPFAPFNQAALTLFWSALLREPVDLAGAAASALVIGCYRQSCSHQMGKLFPGILPSVTGLEITAAEVTPEPDVGSIESSAAGVAISTANYLRFNPPGHIWKYHEMVDAIMALPIERLRHPTEVARARKWLVAKMTGTQSYRVASACADRLAKLGWATSKADTVRVMLKAVVGAAQRWCGKDLRTTCEVLTSAIAIDPDFAKLTAVRYATPLPVEALIKTVIDYSACDVPISAELLEWTARQPIFAAQPGKILARIGCGNRCRPLDLLELCRSHVNGDDAHFDALLAESVQEPPSNTMAGKMARLVMLFSLHLRHDNSACPDTGANWLLRFEDEICQRQFPDLYKTKLSFEDQERLSRIIQLAKRAIHLRGLDSRLVGLMRSLLFSCLDKPHLKNLAVSVIRVNLDLRTCNGEQLSRVKRLLFGRFDSNERWDPGFWNADVVEPSLKLFVPHWDMLIAEYVVLRIRGVWRPPTLGMLLGGEFVTRFSNFSNEKLKSLVWMCLHVHRHLQDQSSGTTSSWNNPIFYLGSVPIAEACQFLSSLSSNAPTLTTTTESHICQFLLEFLRSRQTALCVEEGRAFVYSANERVELPCESKTFVRSLVEAAQNLESTAAATRPLLGPANVPRVAAASLSRSTYVIAWQPAYPPSVPPDDFSERPSLDAVFTTDSGT